MDTKNRIEDIKDQVGKVIEEELSNRDMALNQILGILFWKDGRKGYADDFMMELMRLMRNYKVKGPEDESWVDIDVGRVLEIANKIRANMGVPTLRKESWGLQENGRE